MNHSACSPASRSTRCGWRSPTRPTSGRLRPGHAGRRGLRRGADRLTEPSSRPRVTLSGDAVPVEFGPTPQRETTSQEAFARALVDLARYEDVAQHLVTTSPDVSISTGLGGWINKRGVFAPTTEEVYESTRPRRCAGRPARTASTSSSASREMNLFLLLGQLGLGASCTTRSCCRSARSTTRSSAAASTRSSTAPTRARSSCSPARRRASRCRARAARTSRRSRRRSAPSCPGLRSTSRASRSRRSGSCSTRSATCATASTGESAYLRLSTTPVCQQPFADLLARQRPRRGAGGVLSGAYRLASRPPASTAGAA